MNKKMLYLILIALMICILGGCAKGIIKTIKIDYAPSQYFKVTDAAKTIEVNRLKDVRGVDPKLLYSYISALPPISYVSDREVSDIITDAIKNFLTNQNYRIVNDKGMLTLTGEILKIELRVLQRGFLGVGDLTEWNIQVNLRLLDNNDRNIKWNEILSGIGRKTGVHLKEVFEMALDNLMSNISDSISFNKAIERSD
jgi:hypothetical protein